MKFVYAGNVARIMQILSMNAHQDKRPMTALVAKAVEICHQKGMKYFVYGKFIYGRRADSGVVEFKRRLGFEPVELQRYYVPLSLRGRLALKLGLHKGWRELLPPKLVSHLIKFRAWWLQKTARRIKLQAPKLDHSGESAARGSSP
jgi:hypothetical protein